MSCPTLLRSTVALAIFAFSYYFVAGGRFPGLRLDRPGGALFGAALMVAAGVVAPHELVAGGGTEGAISFDTLVLLLAMMLLAQYLAEARFFRTAAYHVMRLARSPRGLLVGVAVISATLSAVLVNDTVCLVLTPLVLSVVEESRLPPAPFLLALCMASNAGSVATFTGNPQNMLIHVSSHLGYARFAGDMILPAAGATGVVIGLLLVAFKSELPEAPFSALTNPPAVDRRLLSLTLLVLTGVMVAFFGGAPVAGSALAGACLLMALAPRSPRRLLEQVDYVLLVLFACLFVLTYGLADAGWAERARQWFSPVVGGSALRESLAFALLSLVASNVLSNVPFVMLARHWVPSMHDPRLAWEVLALSSTLAGNLTLVGSVANLIVFEGARGRAPMSFGRYFRLGLPVTLLSLAVGLSLLWVERMAWGAAR